MNANAEYYGEHWAESMSADIALAQKKIIITAQSIQPPRTATGTTWAHLYAEWLAALRRNVRIHAWMPAPLPNNHATSRNVACGGELAAAGIIVHYVTGNRLLHAKTCVIDDTIVWIGSGNFTAAAANHNFEAYLRCESPRIAAALTQRWQAIA